MEALEPRILLSGLQFPCGLWATDDDPCSVVAADFNDDSLADLAAANKDDDTVSVLLGRGDGTFDGATDFAVGQTPYEVVTADFNRDGALELATANRDDHSVSVLLGNGGGAFDPQVVYELDPGWYMYPEALAAGDITGDGWTDIVATGRSGVYVLINAGDGTFGADAPDYYKGCTSAGVFAGDFDSDGDLDLVIANAGSNTISYLANAGDGTYPAYVDLSVGTDWSYDLTGADLNQDGHLDLVSTNSPGFSVFLGNGDGTLQPRTDQTIPTTVGRVACADVTGDGRPDLILTRPGGDESWVTLAQGSGDGSFQLVRNHAVGEEPAGLAMADFSRDGKLDLAVGFTGSSCVAVCLGQGGGDFWPDEASTGDALVGVTAGDLNNDSIMDLVSANEGADSVSVILGEGDGAFSPPVDYPAGTDPQAVVAAGFNNDEFLDLVASNQYGKRGYPLDGSRPHL